MGRKTFVVVLLAVIIGGAFAQELPRIINYQGKLTDASGVAVTGPVNITFRIFNVATGGTALWTEVHSGVDAIAVTNGLFDVQLGGITDLDLSFDREYWIELQIGTETLTPREKLATVPYAFRAIYADTAFIIGSGAVQTDGTINGDGTDGDPLSVNWGSVEQHTDVTSAGSGAIITVAERANLHAPGSDNQNLFNRVSDGTNTYTVATQTGILNFTGTGGAAVSVNPATGQVTIDASSAGDNWGTQVVQSNATLSGTGITGNLLGIAADGVNATHIDWGNGANQVDATDMPYFSGHDWNWIDPDPTNSGDAFDELAIKVESIIAGGGEPNQEITTGDGVTGADGGTTGDFTIDVVYGGTGTATSVARSDHNHDAVYDDYNSWNLQANGGATVGITSGSNVNFAQAGLATVSRSGNTITISSAGDNWGSTVVQSDATLAGTGVTGNLLGIAQQGASNGQVLKWNGASWVPNNDNNTTYSAGNGISLSGTTFSVAAGTGLTQEASGLSHTAHTGDATGASALTVVGIQGRAVENTAPTSNQVLKWNGASWAPAADEGGTDNQGLTAVAVTGGAKVDISGSTSDVDLIGSGATTISRTGANQITISSTDNNTTYSAGNGISLSGTTFSVAAGTGLTQDASGLALTEIYAGQTTEGALWYNGTTRETGRLYGGTTDPSSTTRLNYDGYFYATRLYSNGVQVLTGNQTITLTGDVTGSGATSIATTIANLAWSKLANGTANRILMTNGSGVVAEVAAPTTNYYLKWNGTAYTWAAASTDLANLTAGAGLSGTDYNGSTARTFAVNAGNGLGISGDDVVVNAGNGIEITSDAVTVKPADGTINVSAGGVRVGLGAPQSTSTSYQLHRNY